MRSHGHFQFACDPKSFFFSIELESPTTSQIKDSFYSLDLSISIKLEYKSFKVSMKNQSFNKNEHSFKTSSWKFHQNYQQLRKHFTKLYANFQRWATYSAWRTLKKHVLPCFMTTIFSIWYLCIQTWIIIYISFLDAATMIWKQVHIFRDG